RPSAAGRPARRLCGGAGGVSRRHRPRLNDGGGPVAHILLVHGSCHGAWCWDRVVPALARHGHAARAIDLPAHGDDRTPAGDATLDLYAGRILAAIDAPTVLVGHSAAGYPITLAAALGGPKVAA